jgi:hypothetical protein
MTSENRFKIIKDDRTARSAEMFHQLGDLCIHSTRRFGLLLARENRDELN